MSEWHMSWAWQNMGMSWPGMSNGLTWLTHISAHSIVGMGGYGWRDNWPTKDWWDVSCWPDWMYMTFFSPASNWWDISYFIFFFQEQSLREFCLPPRQLGENKQNQGGGRQHCGRNSIYRICSGLALHFYCWVIASVFMPFLLLKGHLL